MSEQGDMLGMPADVESLIGHDLGELPDKAWSQSLTDMLRVIEAAFVRKRESKERAFALSQVAISALCEYHGGRMWYLPRGDRMRAALRDAEIFRRAKLADKFQKGNIRELAGEYRLSEIHLYKIYRQQLKLHQRKLQGRLFED